MRIGADRDFAHMRQVDSGRDRCLGNSEQGHEGGQPVQLSDLPHLSRQQPTHALRVLMKLPWGSIILNHRSVKHIPIFQGH